MSDLLLSDWDFRKCPKNELRDCLFYELAREISEWHRKVEYYRSDSHKWARMLPPQGPHFGIRGINITPDDTFESNLCFITAISDWPNLPWLSLPTTDRKKHSARNLNVPYDLSEGLQGHIGALGGDNNQFLESRTFEHQSHKVTYAVVKIDWRINDTDLTKQFQKWLKSLGRPHDPIEKRGQKLDPQDVLKSLGALRLLKKMNWQKASILTGKTLPKGQPLYSNQANWSRAKSNALRAIAVFQQSQSIDKVLQRSKIPK